MKTSKERAEWAFADYMRDADSPTSGFDDFMRAVSKAIDEAVAEEREACAKVAEQEEEYCESEKKKARAVASRKHFSARSLSAAEIYLAIRARGSK